MDDPRLGRRRPFGDTADPDTFYPSPAHASASAELFAALKMLAGLVVLIGEPGTGKTTVLRRVVRDVEGAGGRVLWCSVGEELDAMMASLVRQLGGADAAPPPSMRETFLAALSAHAHEHAATVIAIDEAQSLGHAEIGGLLELAEAAAAAGTRLVILLVGMPELDVKLASLGRRSGPPYALRLVLSPLAASEVGPYVAYRLRRNPPSAAAQPDAVFQPEAVERVAAYAEGIPRVINQLCDAALRNPHSDGGATITAPIVDAAARELDLSLPKPLPTPDVRRPTKPDARPRPTPNVRPLPTAEVRQPARRARPAARRRARPARALRRAGPVAAGLAGLAGVAVALFALWPPSQSSRPDAVALSTVTANAPATTGDAKEPDPPPESTNVTPSGPTGAPVDIPPSDARPAPAEVTAPESPPVTPGPEAQRPADAPRVSRPAPPAARGRAEPPQSTRRNRPPEPRTARITPGAIHSPREVPPLARPVAPQVSPSAPALLIAAEVGNLTVAQALLAAGASPDAPDAKGMTPLMLAVVHDHGAVAELLLARSADVNASGDGGVTALMLAANNGRAAFLQRLISRGANVNAQTRDGWTALTYAAWKGHPSVARRLLAAGADPTLTDRQGWTALRYASWRAEEVAQTRTGNAADPLAAEYEERVKAAHTRYAELVDLLRGATGQPSRK
jgi:type II secretory pathway predicted ATPase ExeA